MSNPNMLKNHEVLVALLTAGTAGLQTTVEENTCQDRVW